MDGQQNSTQSGTSCPSATTAGQQQQSSAAGQQQNGQQQMSAVQQNSGQQQQPTSTTASQPSNGGQPTYSIPGIVHYLQYEWSRFEMQRQQWEVSVNGDGRSAHQQSLKTGPLTPQSES